jgi:FAD/FMN-containing dehydrogenase
MDMSLTIITLAPSLYMLQIDMVQCVRFVDYWSIARTACRGDSDGGAVFRGVAGGLGLLGVVTSVTLRSAVSMCTQRVLLSLAFRALSPV